MNDVIAKAIEASREREGFGKEAIARSMDYQQEFAAELEQKHRAEEFRFREALAVAVKRLREECACPCETDYRGKPILCDICEDLELIAAILAGEK